VETAIHLDPLDDMATRPSLTQVGVRKLDRLLRESVKSRRVPATFFGLTNSKETFYWNCHGPVDFENPDGAAVDENTGEYGRVESLAR
jgi:hypothetical protein